MFNKRCVKIVMGVLFLTSSGLSAQQTPPSEPSAARTGADARFAAIHEAYLAKYQSLYCASRQAWWTATTTGTDEAFAKKKRIEEALVDLHSDRETFATLKALKEGGHVSDPTLRRLLDLMYLTFFSGQGDVALQRKLVAIEADIEQVFNGHRSQVGGAPRTENEVRRILANSKNPTEVKAAWQAYMAVGAKLEKKLRLAVRLRNQIARELGFRDFYAMRISLSEIDEADLRRLFDELDTLTAKPFAELKTRIDTQRAQRFGIDPSQLRPWHFGDLFFQGAPTAEAAQLDAVFQNQDLLALSKVYYTGLGLEVADILERSDLYERPGKTPHAFAADLDRVGDIRIVCNLQPNLYWMDTLLHELGHAVYDEYIRRDLPFILRTAAHSVITEGCAMMMGAMAKNEEYLAKVVSLPPGQAADLGRVAREALCAEKLIFSRWAQVMVRFERRMYEDPDQDLGKLWWDLKKRYQLLNPPDGADRPDYAAKVHVLSHPAYYHSYMMGDLFAAQVQHHICKTVLGLDAPLTRCFHGRKEAGDYLRTSIFAPGKLYPWNELTRRATGEPLTAKYFAQLYVRRPAAGAAGG